MQSLSNMIAILILGLSLQFLEAIASLVVTFTLTQSVTIFEKMYTLDFMIAILIIGLSLQFFNKVIELDLELGILIINVCQPI